MTIEPAAYAENRFKKYLLPTLEIDLAAHAAELKQTVKLEKIMNTAWSDLGMLVANVASLRVTWVMSVNGQSFQVECVLTSEQVESASETTFYFKARQCSSAQSFDVYPYISNLLDVRQYEIIDGAVKSNQNTALKAKIRETYDSLPADQIPVQACRITVTPIGKDKSFTFCGGSYVSSKGIILTDRHCFNRSKMWQMPEANYAVTCGNLKPQSFTREDVILPDDLHNVSADAALINLKSPMPIKPLPLIMGRGQIKQELANAVQCSFFVGAERKTLSPEAFLGITIDPELLNIARYWAVGFQRMIATTQPNLPIVPGDSGSPLACQRTSGDWVQIGLVNGDNQMTGALLSNPLSNVRKFVLSHL